MQAVLRLGVILVCFALSGALGQKMSFITSKEQTACHECLQSGSHVCKLGGFAAQSSGSEAFQYTGYSDRFASPGYRQADVCCADYKTCNPGASKSFALCSHLAKTESMKYTFCEYNEQVCLDSQSHLVPAFGGRQTTGSAPGMFYTNSSCHWKIGAPTEWTDNTRIKVKIKKLVNATCFVNSKGTIVNAHNEVRCQEGDELEFKYFLQDPDHSIYLVSYATYFNPKGKIPQAPPIAAAGTGTATGGASTTTSGSGAQASGSTNSTSNGTANGNTTAESGTATTTASATANGTTATASTSGTGSSTATASAGAAGTVVAGTTGTTGTTTPGQRRVLKALGDDPAVPVIGHIEFEFWAENEVVYDRLIIYVFGGFLTIGTCICCCLNLMYKQGIQEELDSVRHRLWRLRGKSKDYLDENAPNVLEFVRLKEELTRDEESPFGKPGEAAPGKTDKQRIHELENELEDPWCCPTGLAPLRSVRLAVFLCILNILSPGLGTFCSICCFKN